MGGGGGERKRERKREKERERGGRVEIFSHTLKMLLSFLLHIILHLSTLEKSS